MTPQDEVDDGTVEGSLQKPPGTAIFEDVRYLKWAWRRATAVSHKVLSNNSRGEAANEPSVPPGLASDNADQIQ